MNTLTYRQWILLAAGASLALLAGAFIFQALGYAPCKLCLWQRWPHAAAIVIGALALALPGGRLALPWLGAATMAGSAGLGLYHSGIERGWWQGPTTCTSSGVQGLSVEELMDQILAAPLVRCDEIPWRLSDMIPLEVLDITMANLNAVGSVLFALIWIAAARR